MTVLVYTRHSGDCPKQDDRYWRRCDCPKWHQYQHNERQFRETAKTRSWETASKKARELEQRLESGLPAEAPKQKTVADAVQKYLAAKKTDGLGPSAYGKQKGLLERMDKWLQGRGVLYLKDVTADLLSDWRGEWKFKKYQDGQLSVTWKVYWCIVRAFFTYAHNFGWIAANEADKLSKFKTASKQVQPFTKAQMKAILEAIPQMEGWDADKIQRITALVLLMRWSGLSIRDTVQLKRSALDDQGRITTARKKTKTPVCLLLPPAVADTLRELPETRPGYFFDWIRAEHDIGSQYRLILLPVFEKVGISDGHTHRFRHTFACENLLAGMRLEEVARLIGHKSIAVLQKHYSAWIPERQKKLEDAQTAAWAMQELPV